MTARIHAMLTSLLRGNITARIPSFERNNKKSMKAGAQQFELFNLFGATMTTGMRPPFEKQDNAMALDNLNCSNCLVSTLLANGRRACPRSGNDGSVTDISKSSECFLGPTPNLNSLPGMQQQASSS